MIRLITYYEWWYIVTYGILFYSERTVNSNVLSAIGEYSVNVDYDITAVLSGEADQLRIQRKMQSLLDNTYVEYYDNDYDDESWWENSGFNEM